MHMQISVAGNSHLADTVHDHDHVGGSANHLRAEVFTPTGLKFPELRMCGENAAFMLSTSSISSR